MDYQVKKIHISRRSRVFTKVLKWTLKPLIRLFSFAGVQRVVREQVRMASHQRKSLYGLPTDYRVINRVLGPTVGDFEDTSQPAILYLHGGGFLMPAVPMVHLPFMATLCKDLGAVGFMPDYRLAPFHKFPSSLDDCERAYEGLLDLGFDANRIIIAGESAGGNLTLGTLQRIRKAGLPMPACAVPISPVTEMARVHAPPSRVRNARKDPLLPINTFGKMHVMYAQGWDASDPELSPIYADFTDFPPLYFLVGETEVLLDDTLIPARRAREAGVDVELDVWPVMPHAFPLFKKLLPEVSIARQDIVAFIDKHIDSSSAKVQKIANLG
ncbi:MAG: alpha/beta hydrolase [Salinisphaeraceae bacterium]|nr:alpha/beta hydrolase [Salinisphaeraceae bacterium]